MTCSPDRLAALVAAKDEDALKEIARCYMNSLMATGVRACRDGDAAQDAVQDTLVTAAERLDDYRGDGSLEGWLKTIVVRACARRRRGMKNSPHLHEVDRELISLGDTPEDEAFQSELGGRLGTALLELSEQDRLAVLLTQVEGVPGPEAAETLGLTPDALRARLSRARKKLRGVLADVHGETAVED